MRYAAFLRGSPRPRGDGRCRDQQARDQQRNPTGPTGNIHLTRSGWPLTMELAVVAPRGFQSPAMADWESSEAPIPVAVDPGPCGEEGPHGGATAGRRIQRSAAVSSPPTTRACEIKERWRSPERLPLRPAVDNPRRHRGGLCCTTPSAPGGAAMKGCVPSYETKAGRRWRIPFDRPPRFNADTGEVERRQTTRRGFRTRRGAEQALR